MYYTRFLGIITRRIEVHHYITESNTPEEKRDHIIACVAQLSGRVGEKMLFLSRGAECYTDELTHDARVAYASYEVGVG
jgi:hypothetical protein